jgi:hypothetical protein
VPNSMALVLSVPIYSMESIIEPNIAASVVQLARRAIHQLSQCSGEEDEIRNPRPSHCPDVHWSV